MTVPLLDVPHSGARRRVVALMGASLLAAGILITAPTVAFAAAQPTFTCLTCHYADTVTITNPGAVGSYVGSAASLQISAASSQGYSLTYQATGLPPGLVINHSAGLISGTVYSAGSWSVTVTATDAVGTQGWVTFTWTTSLPPRCFSQPCV